MTWVMLLEMTYQKSHFNFRPEFGKNTEKVPKSIFDSVAVDDETLLVEF